MARSLGDEVGKRGAFDLPEQEAFLNLVRTHAALGAGMDALLKTKGLSQAQYNVLRILRGNGAHGAKGEGMPCAAVGSQTVARLPDLTRLLDRMEDAGLVTRTRGDEDRRVVRVKATAQGLRLLASLDAAVLRVHKEQLGHLSEREMRDLNRLLVKARTPSAPGTPGAPRTPGSREKPAG